MFRVFSDRVLVARLMFSAAGLFTILILIFVLFKIFNPPTPRLVSYNPLNGARNQSIFPTISATFSSQASNSFRSEVIFESAPEIKGDILWSDDGKTIWLMVNEPLRLKANYKITLKTKHYSKSWGFTTVDESNLSKQDLESLQGYSDYKTGQETAEFFKTHSWYDSTPIVTENFFIAFVTNTNSFVAYLYPKQAGPESIDDQVVKLKKEVLQALADIGVKTSDYTIDWITQPK